MERRQFLSTIGTAATSTLILSCLQGCSDATTPSGPVDFVLDLSKSENSVLLTKGGYLVSNSCVVAYGIDGNYYAATVICSHEGERKVSYDERNDNYYCSAHGARYTKSGAGLNSEGKNGLTIYKTELSGIILRVHS